MNAIEQVRRDFIAGVRLHARTPLATACVVVTLSIGVAATSASFALLNALFIRQLPVREPDRLVRVYWISADSPQHFPGRIATSKRFGGCHMSSPAPPPRSRHR